MIRAAMKSSVIHKFNRAVNTYDVWSDVQIFAMQKVCERLPAYQPAYVLEIGCGTGQLSSHLVKQYPSSRFLLIDAAPNMVFHCSKKLGPCQNVSFEIMDAEFIQETALFDLIVSSMTMHWFSAPQETLQRLKKALRPGGVFVFAALGSSSLREWREAGLACGVDLGIRDFLSQQLLEENLPGIDLQVHTLRQRYDDSWHFLSTLKNIGGTAAREGHYPVSTIDLKKVMHTLDHQHHQGVFITYELLSGLWRKPL
ncbi:MAG: methyltransferase domain-containing protein [Holosporales bacterium]|jgi:malonyl-CoA O-methyltransferase|nr:methyltransferase domain-containing protein [Holosporales bacterium]